MYLEFREYKMLGNLFKSLNLFIYDFQIITQIWEPYLSKVIATIMKMDAVIAMLLPGYNRYGNRCTWSDVDMSNISCFLKMVDEKSQYVPVTFRRLWEKYRNINILQCLSRMLWHFFKTGNHKSDERKICLSTFYANKLYKISW